MNTCRVTHLGYSYTTNNKGEALRDARELAAQSHIRTSVAVHKVRTSGLEERLCASRAVKGY